MAMLKEIITDIGVVIATQIPTQISLVIGIFLGFQGSNHFRYPPEEREAIVKITEVAISKDLINALDITGCISLPHWDVEGAPGVQICTYGETLHRRWIYSPEQRKARKLERLEKNK